MGSFRILVAVVVAFVAICGGSATASPVVAPKHANLLALARGLVKAGAPGALVYLRTPNGFRSASAGNSTARRSISIARL